jgi:hypothetical protein
MQAQKRDKGRSSFAATAIRRGVAGVGLACALVLAGCQGEKPVEPPLMPGAGLRSYRQLVIDLRMVIAVTRQSAENVGAASAEEAPAAWARFDAALQRLEVTSIRARARADAMEQRGGAYLQEWAEEMKDTPDEAARRERYAELRRQFDGILEGSREVRAEFRPFLAGLRAQRTALGPQPDSAAIEPARAALKEAAEHGRRAEAAIERLVQLLDAAEIVVLSGPPMGQAKPGEGRKGLENSKTENRWPKEARIPKTENRRAVARGHEAVAGRSYANCAKEPELEEGLRRGAECNSGMRQIENLRYGGEGAAWGHAAYSGGRRKVIA